MLNFIRVVSHDKWFKISASKRLAPQDRRDAISTLLPDQYLSGDAIRLSLNALQYESPRDQYVFDTLLSQIYGTDRTDRLWQALWRRSKQTGKTRLRSIILPINERNYHWYIATPYMYQKIRTEPGNQKNILAAVRFSELMGRSK